MKRERKSEQNLETVTPPNKKAAVKSPARKQAKTVAPQPARAAKVSVAAEKTATRPVAKVTKSAATKPALTAKTNPPAIPLPVKSKTISAKTEAPKASVARKEKKASKTVAPTQPSKLKKPAAPAPTPVKKAKAKPLVTPAELKPVKARKTTAALKTATVVAAPAGMKRAAVPKNASERKEFKGTKKSPRVAQQPATLADNASSKTAAKPVVQKIAPKTVNKPLVKILTPETTVPVAAAVKPIKKKIKPISSAVLRGKSGRYDFEVFPLDAEFEKIPAIYVISKRVTDKHKRSHHRLICIGETASIFDDIKRHKKDKCIKANQANVVCLLKEQDENNRLRIASDLREAHAIVCHHK